MSINEWSVISRSLNNKKFILSLYKNYIFEEEGRIPPVKELDLGGVKIKGTRDLILNLANGKIKPKGRNSNRKAQFIVNILKNLKKKQAFDFYLRRGIENPPVGDKYDVKAENHYLDKYQVTGADLKGLSNETKKVFLKNLPNILIDNSGLQERLRKFFVKEEARKFSRNGRIRGNRLFTRKRNYLVSEVFTIQRHTGKTFGFLEDFSNAESKKVEEIKNDNKEYRRKKALVVKHLKKKGFSPEKVRKRLETGNQEKLEEYSTGVEIMNPSTKEKTIKLTNLRDMVKEIMLEAAGDSYSPYPYNSYMGEEEEPREDYLEDWKQIEMDVIRDESRGQAIEIAKILVKDLELFGDILDLVGRDQSLGTELMQKIRETRKESEQKSTESQDFDLS
tara:strand:- start:718 stop:1893 length:1176 start_codon:yes stop_codon:yes gene_type:complete